jgi:hypothetical protein
MDVGQLASATAGCTAIFKLRAKPILEKYSCFSNSYKISLEALKLASLPDRRQVA